MLHNSLYNNTIAIEMARPANRKEVPHFLPISLKRYSRGRVMTKRLATNVIPLHNDKYYVYALFKPEEFNPFYIGKGIRNRINDHFSPSNLIKNTPKTGIIKKYGNSIRREILVYFDKEEAAYEFEEYLISLYGLESEGGYLVNYAKTRFQYCDKFNKDVAGLGHLSRKRKYSKELIFKALEMFYINRITSDIISNELSIDKNYLLYVLSGKKCKYEFSEFVTANKDIEGELEKIRSSLIFHNRSKSQIATRLSISDDVIKEEFKKVVSGNKTVSQASKDIGMRATSLGQIFLGKARPYLQLDYDMYRKNILKGRTLENLKIHEHVKSLLDQGMSAKDIKEITGLGRTTVYRAIRKIEQSCEDGVRH